jgi:hypothetical protein
MNGHKSQKQGRKYNQGIDHTQTPGYPKSCRSATHIQFVWKIRYTSTLDNQFKHLKI